jgi:hypothetical protein
VSDDRVNPETLAAFLDGTASPEEREGVLRTIASSKEAYARFLEAAAVHRELPSTLAVAPDATPGDTATPRPTAQEVANARWFRRWQAIPVLLAAGAAAVLITRAFLGSEPQSIQLVQATSLTREMGSGALTRTFGDGWNQPPWSAVRGSETSVGSRSLSFRAGARYAELELAARASDSAGVISSADAIAGLLATTEAGAALAATFGDMARAPDFGRRRQRASAARRLRASLGAEGWFDLGVWAETARLAVAARDTAFFDARGRAASELRRILQPRVATSAPRNAEWAPVVDALRPLLAERSWSQNELTEARGAIDAAIAAAAR